MTSVTKDSPLSLVKVLLVPMIRPIGQAVLEPQAMQSFPMLSRPLFCEDEFSRLEEVIVGRAEFSHFPSERMSVMASCVPRYHLDEFRPNNPFPAHIVQKAQEELDNFAAVLTSLDVKVRRPDLVDWGKVGGYTAAMPRGKLQFLEVHQVLDWDTRERCPRQSRWNIM